MEDVVCIASCVLRPAYENSGTANALKEDYWAIKSIRLSEYQMERARNKSIRKNV